MANRYRSQSFSRDDERLPNAPHAADRRPVLLVGAGVVNLMTALELVTRGIQVSVVDRSPNPETLDGLNWRDFGCTYAGDNARMFTLSEMDCYNFAVQEQECHAFNRQVGSGGWLLAQPTFHQRRWINEFASVDPRTADENGRIIFGFNREAGVLWSEIASRHPDLFSAVGYTEGVLRIYSSAASLRASVSRHQNIGSFTKAFTCSQLSTAYPALAPALATGAIVGGFTVRGFTLNIHTFCARLRAFLERCGVTFTWGMEIDEVQTAKGWFHGVAEDGRDVSQGRHVIMSLGASGTDGIANAPLRGLIQPVIGGWVRVPVAHDSMPTSLKVHRKGHAAEDANVTRGWSKSGQELAIIGSGYGLLPHESSQPPEDALRRLRVAVEATATALFGVSAQELRTASDANDDYGFKYCARPWTADSRGIFHAEGSPTGPQLIITGGHNTGGFTQSPRVGQAVANYLAGVHDPMHDLYRPTWRQTDAAGARVAAS